MIAGDSGDGGGVLISVVVDHGHGDGDRLPCLLYQMPPGLCAIPVVLPSFVAWNFSVTCFVEETLPMY